MLKARLHCLAPLPELRSLAPCALPAAQALFLALPDELLGSILRRAWADRPPRPAGEEVRAAAGLALVCRRVRALLRERPLPLALDFSAARLGDEQRRWLLASAQAGRVEAASFDFYSHDPHGNSEYYDQESTANLPFLADFLALHGGTLLRLSGMPLRLVARASQGERPALDLSGLRLTKLGLACNGIHHLLDMDPPFHVWLWPECLPDALEELELLHLYHCWICLLAWAPHSGSGSAGRLPRLHTLRVTHVDGVPGPLSVNEVPLEGFPGLLNFDVAGPGADVNIFHHIHTNLFGRVRSVRIVTGGRVQLCNHRDDMATFVDALCPTGQQAAELCAEIVGVYRARHGQETARDVVRELISRCEDRFAVEVGVPGKPPGVDWCTANLRRLAWRRWPAPDAPDLPAARAAHGRARAWAAEGGQRQLQQ